MNLGSPPHRASILFATTLATLLAATACASGGRPTAGGDPFRGGGGGGASTQSDEIQIRVHNANFNEARIYAVRPGVRRRVGRIQGANDEVFRIPWSVTNTVRFEIDVLGGQRCTTRTVQAIPGETLLLTIESSPRPSADGRRRLCDVVRAR
jgi:hypothetical protein